MQRDPVLIVLCGLSFSGKSTLAAELAASLPAEIVSLDAINAERGLHGGQGIALEEWGRTNVVAHERATALLRAGSSVVVDDTGSPRFLRDEWRATAAGEGVAPVLVWVRIGAALQRSRVLATRERGDRPDVTDGVLRDHGEHFEPPSDDESPLVVDAADTTDAERIAELVGRIRGD